MRGHGELPRGFRLRLVQSFAAAGEAWASLESRCAPYPFQRCSWLETWQSTIGDARGYSPAIGIIEASDGSAQALLPLAWRKGRAPRRLEWMGWGVSDYSGPMVAPDSGVDGDLLMSALRAMARETRCGLMVLERNPGLLGGLANPLLSEGLREIHYGSHYAAVPEDLGAFLKERFGSKASYNLRRAEKRLGELGELEFIVASDAERRAEITASMIRHKRERYREQRVRDNFEEPSFARFYESYADMEGAHLSALYFNGRPIAEHWGLVDGERMYLLMPSFEAGELDKYSPGSILIAKLFGLCARKGIRVIDFTAGDEDYKERWCEFEMPLYRLVEGRGPAGRACALAIEAGEAARRGPLLGAGRAVKRFFYSRLYAARSKPN